VGKDGFGPSFAAVKRGGLLCAYGYVADVKPAASMLTILMWIVRLYLWRWSPGGRRAGFFSVNVMRAQHAAWFRQDLGQLFGLLAPGAIRPSVAERISFDEVAEAHRRLEAGGLEGRLVLCPDLPLRSERAAPGQAPAV
jgi:NADPH:quinone reductase-like Zn-dependent oxidoreductase